MKAHEALDQIKRFFQGLEISEETLVELAEGKETEVECARSGKFTDMGGNTVTFDAPTLSALAETLDPEDALCKIGHVEIETTTPDYGSVTGLRYDAAADRLLAKIAPTPALVKKNREEGFRRVSMELAGKSLEGPFRFQHLAFLAARKPAVRGLAPVALAAAEGEQTFVFAEGEQAGEIDFYFRSFDAKARKAAAKTGAAMPDGSFPIENEGDLKNAIQAIGRASDPAAAKAHIKTRAKALGLTNLLPTDWKGAEGLDTAPNLGIANDETEKGNEETTQMNEQEIKAKELELATAKEAADKSKAEADRLRRQLAEGAAPRVKAFLAANTKRIPMTVLKAGLEEALTAMLADEAVRADVTILKFSIPGAAANAAATVIEETPSAVVMRMLAALPELVTGAETTETATEANAAQVAADVAAGTGDLSPVVKFAASDRHPQVLAKLAALRKTDPKATYTQALEAWSAEVETAEASKRIGK